MTVSTTVASGPGGAARAPGQTALRCIITRESPTEWAADLQACDGGFFHASPGADVGGPPGEPVFVRIFDGMDVVGISAGVRRTCRLSESPRHFYFPTNPALAPGVNPAAALDSLIGTLHSQAAAEVVMESFDARWSADGQLTPSEVRARDEYVVQLNPDTDKMLAALSSGHRRQIRKGERSDWRVECPEGGDARDLLVSVQQVAAQRAAARGNGFAVRVPTLIALDRAGERPWGASMFAAWRDGSPLAAALVGWANKRAFYVMGGSTPAGYECGASVWLHWRIACRLAESGFLAYNLGGASAAAATPAHPAHGLYRFKMGFGARVVPCRSSTWTLSAAHARVHQLRRWLGNPYSSQES